MVHPIAADKFHRQRAVDEQVLADLKAEPLAHMLSKVFQANAAWPIAVAIINTDCPQTSVAISHPVEISYCISQALECCIEATNPGHPLITRSCPNPGRVTKGTSQKPLQQTQPVQGRKTSSTLQPVNRTPRLPQPLHSIYHITDRWIQAKQPSQKNLSQTCPTEIGIARSH